MKLALLSDDGEVIDTSEEFTHKEWTALLNNPLGAAHLLRDPCEAPRLQAFIEGGV
jgi:hypothetical protein